MTAKRLQQRALPMAQEITRLTDAFEKICPNASATCNRDARHKEDMRVLAWRCAPRHATWLIGASESLSFTRR